MREKHAEARLLVVEDDPIIVRDLRHRLKLLGYAIAGVAESGDKALEATEAGQPDLVLMDIQLEGGMDGVQAAARINEKFGVPVVFLTSSSDAETVRRAASSNPFGYIIKPINTDILRATLETALYKHTSEMRIREQEQRWSAILASVGDGVIVANGAGQLTFMNPVAEKLCGWKSGDALGRALEDVFVLEDRHTALPLFEGRRPLDVMQGLEPARYVHLVNQNGRKTPITVHTTSLDENLENSSSVVISLQDMRAQVAIESELARREYYFRSLIEKSFDLILVLTREGQVMYASPSSERLLGYHQNDLVEQSLLDIVHENDRKAFADSIAAGFQDDTVLLSLDVRFRSQEKGWRHFEGAGRQIADLNGVPRFVLNVRDVTERVKALSRLQNSERRYRAIVEDQTELICRFLPDGTLNFVNDAFADFFGKTPEDLLGSDFRTLIDPADEIPGYAKLANLQPDAQVLRFEMTHRQKKQSADTGTDTGDVWLEWLEWTVRGIFSPEGELLEIQGVARDISDRKKAEKLKQDKEAAEASNKAKSQFLANISHEIRTPMNGVMGMAEMLLESETSREQQEYVQTIMDSSRAMLAIINDLLDFSRIESGKVELYTEPIHLCLLVEEVTALFAPQAAAKGLEIFSFFPPDLPCTFLGDAGRIRQVLLNLVNNAVKFTEEGRVAVLVQAHPEKPDTWSVSVCDTGIGIAADKLERIFERFSQADTSSTRLYGGTGLGLTISRQLTELMGGSLDVQSTSGAGSCFTAHFPLPLSGDAGNGLCVLNNWQEQFDQDVLLLSQKPGLQESMEKHMTALGNRLSLSGGLDEAERLVAEKHFDFVFVDHLPNRADEVGKILKDAGVNPDSPLIQITEPGDPQAVSPAEGYTAILRQPLRSSRLYRLFYLIKNNPEEFWAGADLLCEQETAWKSASNLLPRFEARILLAEDNRTNQTVARKMLKRLGCRVDVVENGEEALNALARDSYDCVLMDCQMPVLDGYAAVEAWRSREAAGHRLPIIALTAHAAREERGKVRAVGMDDYLAKPVSLARLAKMLANYLPAQPGETLAAGAPVRETVSEEAEETGAEAAESGKRDSPEEQNGERRVFNPEEALEQLGDDPELLVELKDIFFADLEGHLAAIHTALSEGDQETAERLSHALKGGASNICAEKLRHLFYTMEHAASDGRWEAFTASLDRVNAAVDAFQEAWKAWKA